MSKASQTALNILPHCKSLPISKRQTSSASPVTLPQTESTKLHKKLRMSKDPEGDSHMSPATDSSQGEGSDAMFPAANEAPAPPNVHAPIADQQAAGELSPPYSQDQPDANDDEAMDLTGAEPAWDASTQNINTASDGNAGKSEFARSAEAQHQPGASWDNPKAREECQRQWNALLDKNFSLSKKIFIITFVVPAKLCAERFGDPFDEDQLQGGK